MMIEINKELNKPFRTLVFGIVGLDLCILLIIFVKKLRKRR